MKKINFTTIALLVYLAVMSVIGWPGKKADPDWTQYFLIIGLTLGVILLLRFAQIRRFKTRRTQAEDRNTQAGGNP